MNKEHKIKSQKSNKKIKELLSYYDIYIDKNESRASVEEYLCENLKAGCIIFSSVIPYRITLSHIYWAYGLKHLDNLGAKIYLLVHDEIPPESGKYIYGINVLDPVELMGKYQHFIADFMEAVVKFENLCVIRASTICKEKYIQDDIDHYLSNTVIDDLEGAEKRYYQTEMGRRMYLREYCTALNLDHISEEKKGAAIIVNLPNRRRYYEYWDKIDPPEGKKGDFRLLTLQEILLPLITAHPDPSPNPVSIDDKDEKIRDAIFGMDLSIGDYKRAATFFKAFGSLPPDTMSISKNLCQEMCKTHVALLDGDLGKGKTGKCMRCSRALEKDALLCVTCKNTMDETIKISTYKTVKKILEDVCTEMSRVSAICEIDAIKQKDWVVEKLGGLKKREYAVYIMLLYEGRALRPSEIRKKMENFCGSSHIYTDLEHLVKAGLVRRVEKSYAANERKICFSFTKK